MAIERTFSIIKPDATRRNLTGAINAKIEAAGLRIIAQRRTKWKQADARKFYAVHAKRPFYKDLVKFMTSSPVLVPIGYRLNTARCRMGVVAVVSCSSYRKERCPS